MLLQGTEKNMGESKQNVSQASSDNAIRNTRLQYDLKIDEQVAAFLETKQKLTYFLITASVAVTAFLINFAMTNRAEVRNITWLIITSAVGGLLTAGFSLLSLHYELRSYNMHLGYRYQRKTWETLTKAEQDTWT